MAPTTQPIEKPNLPKGGIAWRSVNSDQFENETLSLDWHFLSKKYTDKYSLSARKGWLRLAPDSLRTSIVQKETDHYYSAVTKVDFNPADTLSKAGLYLSSGNQRVNVRLYSGFDQGKKISFSFEKNVQSIPNTFGNVVWLKITRKLHELTAYASKDGKTWTPVGTPINVVNLDKTQPQFNSWVGTSVGLFTESKPADFDFFVCKDGFSELPAVGFSNAYGVEKVKVGTDEIVSASSNLGGWFMLSGVELGGTTSAASQVQLQVSAKTAGTLEIWLDDLTFGQRIATIPYSATGSSNWKSVMQKVKGVSGHHDVFVKFPAGNSESLMVKSLQFQK